MNKNQRIITLILGIIIVSFLAINFKKPQNQEKMLDNSARQGTASEPKKETSQEKTTTTPDNTKVGSYETYDASKISRAESGTVILFFHASWCPSCRALNSDIEKNISNIPEQVSILKTNYDTETELKKKYGITYQHTLVQVDQNGEMIKKWSGSPSLSSLLSQISEE